MAIYIDICFKGVPILLESFQKYKHLAMVQTRLSRLNSRLKKWKEDDDNEKEENLYDHDVTKKENEFSLDMYVIHRKYC